MSYRKMSPALSALADFAIRRALARCADDRVAEHFVATVTERGDERLWTEVPSPEGDYPIDQAHDVAQDDLVRQGPMLDRAAIVTFREFEDTDLSLSFAGSGSREAISMELFETDADKTLCRMQVVYRRGKVGKPEVVHSFAPLW